MQIKKENVNNVHYLIGFECDDGFVPSKTKGNECNYMPNDVKKRCKSKVFAAWSYGSKYVTLNQDLFLSYFLLFF